MTTFYEDKRFTLLNGDCRLEMKSLTDRSVDAIVTDPPYELGFMGKGWDRSGIAYDVSVWRECLRVLKPGGHLLAFGGSRTYHRLACAIEDAGFEIRDQIQWLYGSGFPKSLDVPKAIDVAAGAKGDWIRDDHPGRSGPRVRPVDGTFGDHQFVHCRPNNPDGLRHVYEPASNAARHWRGWGTALKPAHEPIVLARKPLIGTVAENVLKHGTGGLNIDGCRIATSGEDLGDPSRFLSSDAKLHDGWQRPHKADAELMSARADERFERTASLGRWPANVIHDGSEEVLAGFPETQSGDLTGQPRVENRIYGSATTTIGTPRFFNGDSGSAARFFYCAKADNFDRNEGLEDLPIQTGGAVTDRKDGGAGLNSPRAGAGRTSGSRNNHPTVKPTDLMRYLCRLVTPPGGMVCDPFCGSGSTGKAAMLEGLRFIGIDLSAEYCQLAKLRIEAVTRQGVLFA